MFTVNCRIGLALRWDIRVGARRFHVPSCSPCHGSCIDHGPLPCRSTADGGGTPDGDCPTTLYSDYRAGGDRCSATIATGCSSIRHRAATFNGVSPVRASVSNSDRAASPNRGIRPCGADLGRARGSNRAPDCGQVQGLRNGAACSQLFPGDYAIAEPSSKRLACTRARAQRSGVRTRARSPAVDRQVEQEHECEYGTKEGICSQKLPR